MHLFQLGIAYDTTADEDFIEILEQKSREINLSTYRVMPWNLGETIGLIADGHLGFKSFYDRASDTSPNFYHLYALMKTKGAFIFQSLERQNQAADKACLHDLFLKNKIPVPHALILKKSAGRQDFQISEDDLRSFKKPFVVKPAVNTGASTGVNVNACSLADVYHTCTLGNEEKYIIQQKIVEKRTARKFWFRVFYVCGTVFVCWWDPQTHRYSKTTEKEIALFGLENLTPHMMKISQICDLNFFSTEFVLDETDHLYAIDYVNEICDLRLQSRHFDGVPDSLVADIARIISNYIKNNIS